MNFSATRFVSLLGLLAVIIGPFGIGGQVSIFINIPSIVGLVSFIFFMLLMNFGKDFLSFIPQSLSVFCFSPKSPNPKYAEIAIYGSKVSICGASLLTLITYIKLLVWKSDPTVIGVSLAISLLPILYGLIISEVFFAISFRAFNSSSKTNIEVTTWKDLILPIIVVLIVSFVSVLSILALSTSM